MAAPFKSILCGVEGSATSIEAARQAVTLAGPGASVHFLAVSSGFEMGEEHRPESLQAALEEAAGIAEEAGVSATTETVEAKHAIDALLPASREHDLLALGTNGRKRVAGIVFGSTASEAAHETERPLLIARDPAEGTRFPSSILLASDGTDSSWAPCRTAGELAAALGASLRVVHVLDGDEESRSSTVDEQLEELEGLTGTRPGLDERRGKPTGEIVDAASEQRPSLLVCGRRGLQGVKALGSVSERVVHKAPSSVLLVPSAPRS